MSQGLQKSHIIGFLLVLAATVSVIIFSDARQEKPPRQADQSVTQSGEAAAEKTNSDDATFFDSFGPSSTSLPAPHGLITNIAERNATSLNGKWNILVDEYDAGTSTFLGGPYYRADPVGDYELREFSLDERRQLSVPGDWNTQDDRLFRYRGTVWYARNLQLQKKTDQRYFLHFDGVNYDASIYVNGQALGQHIGGYTAFNIEATDALIDGENLIVVRVNATLDNTTIPTKVTSDFFKYGGITRDVHLVATAETFIQNYSLSLQDHLTGNVSGWVQLDGPKAANADVTLTIAEANVSVTTRTDASGLAPLNFRADLELWSPAFPKRYDVHFRSGTASINDQIGFRTIARQGEKILLNGAPIFLRGISMHDESYLKPGVAFDKADAREQLGLIKELNGNFVRLSHYPHNEHTLHMADELGLLVWSEIPIVSLIDWDNPKSLEVAKNQIRDNIRRDRNRAAIIMWSIGNETMPQSPERLAFLKALAETVREEDGRNRLIAAALVGDVRHEFLEVSKRLAADMVQSDNIPADVKPHLNGMLTHMGVTDPASLNNSEVEVMLRDKLGEIVDVIGYNEYFGWYYSSFLGPQFPVDEKTVRDFMFPLMKDIRFRNAFGKPMIISEFGGGAKYGKRSDRAVLWSEEYQAKIYRYQLDMLARSRAIQGMSPWILKDFRSSLRNLNGIQDIYNRKGIVSEKGEKKLAFKILQNHYAERINSSTGGN